jgi:hypothetical protein
VLNGDANYLLGHYKSLADVEGSYSIDQGILNAVALTNMIRRDSPNQYDTTGQPFPALEPA